MRRVIKKILLWVFGIQAFIIVPWFLGEIYRREQSIWVWDNFYKDLKKYGMGEALVGVYFYAIFYAAIFLIVYLILYSIYEKEEFSSNKQTEIKEDIFVISIWIFITILFFFNPIMELIHNIHGGWLFVLWVLASVYFIDYWIKFHKRINKEIEVKKEGFFSDDTT